MKIFIEVIGWIGSLEVILAYALNSSQRLKSNSPVFQWLNLTGAIFLIANTAYNESYPSMAINVVWVVVAIVALISITRKKAVQ
jgi:hypothetical protein